MEKPNKTPTSCSKRNRPENLPRANYSPGVIMSDILLSINQKLRQWTQSCPGVPATGHHSCCGESGSQKVTEIPPQWNDPVLKRKQNYPEFSACSHKRQPCFIEDSQTGRWRSRSDSKRISLEAPDQNCQAHFLLLGTPPGWEENWQPVPKTNSAKHFQQKEVVSRILSGKKFSAENLGLSLVHPLVTYTSLQKIKKLESA